ncbi:hypothetical protein BJ508DRAFT_367225 [Ascobolus immersus RN42]|uniref:Uncharacterized protein n=1 Tax=Ascobolus immersus RN42 TaxID=1160509 RepID=A0A3N4HFY9_ASCIM|nr:hypothetical protein BJ508DRAFT_367225 [Ascobolus immersus RN42]
MVDSVNSQYEIEISQLLPLTSLDLNRKIVCGAMSTRGVYRQHWEEADTGEENHSEARDGLIQSPGHHETYDVREAAEVIVGDPPPEIQEIGISPTTHAVEDIPGTFEDTPCISVPANMEGAGTDRPAREALDNKVKRKWDKYLSDFRRRNEYYNHLIDTVLIVTALLCYLGLMLLFGIPERMLPDSLRYADAKSGIQATVLVSLLSSLLSVVTLAYITRNVEALLWSRLLPGKPGLSLREVRDLAQWTVSPVGQILYIFNGSGWFAWIKVIGILLIINSYLGPIILTGLTTLQGGIRNRGDDTFFSIDDYQSYPTKDLAFSYRGWVRISESEFEDESSSTQEYIEDKTIPIAAALALLNATVPKIRDISGLSNTASDADEFSLAAIVPAIQANCTSWERNNTELQIAMGIATAETDGSSDTRKIFRSEINPLLEITLETGSSGTFANFTTSFDEVAGSTKLSVGTFGYIFGGFAPVTGTVHSVESRLYSEPLFFIDCRLSFGTAAVNQSVDPRIPTAYYRESFIEANLTNVYDTDKYIRKLALSYSTHRQAPERRDEESRSEDAPPPKLISSPFTFAKRNSQTSTSSTSESGDSLLSQLLLTDLITKPKKEEENIGGDLVARAIERIWETASILAFIRDPGSSQSLTVTQASTRLHNRFLGPTMVILIFPFLATVLAVVVRKRDESLVSFKLLPYGKKEDIVGYDPLMIARLGGPIPGLDDSDVEDGFLRDEKEDYILKGQVDSISGRRYLEVSQPVSTKREFYDEDGKRRFWNDRHAVENHDERRRRDREDDEEIEKAQKLIKTNQKQRQRGGVV